MCYMYTVIKSDILTLTLGSNKQSMNSMDVYKVE